METPAGLFESVFERLEEYGKTTFELAKLKLLATTITLVTTIISKISVVIVLSLFVFTLTISAALFLGDILGKLYYGFLIISGFYLIAGLLMHFFLHRWLRKPVSELIIKQALK